MHCDFIKILFSYNGKQGDHLIQYVIFGPEAMSCNLVCSACMCTSIVTEIKLVLKGKDGIVSGMQATISCGPSTTSSDFICIQRAEKISAL